MVDNFLRESTAALAQSRDELLCRDQFEGAPAADRTPHWCLLRVSGMVHAELGRQPVCSRLAEVIALRKKVNLLPGPTHGQVQHASTPVED